jgi:hypothetical protein
MEEISDGYRNYIMSTQGIQIVNPVCSSRIEFVSYKYKPRWTEKIKDNLVKKLKCNKAKLNKWIIGLLMIPIVLISLAVSFGICLLSPQSAGWAGIIAVELIALGWITLTGMLETDSHYITVKHKNKYYH